MTGAALAVCGRVLDVLGVGRCSMGVLGLWSGMAVGAERSWMGLEIERKYLVVGDGWRGLGEAVLYRQGYLATGKGLTVRVRVGGGAGELTIKKGITVVSSVEYNFAIPVEDGEEMLDGLCVGGIVEKERRRIDVDGAVWEVDEFRGANAGLVVAEIELLSEDEVVSLPSWIGEEVTGDLRYRNSALAVHPFTEW